MAPTEELPPPEAPSVENEPLETELTTTGRRRRKKTDEFFVSSTLKRRPAKKKKTDEEEYESSWICSECGQAECSLQADADQLLICEGSCRRLSHYPCAGLSALPEGAYICNDCTNQRHMCGFCQEYGTDNEDVFKCERENCGFFFHVHCLAARNIETSQEEGEKPIFTCPAHHCWVCTQTEEAEKEKQLDPKQKKKKKSKSSVFICKKERHMVRCMVCPISYHISCIPPPAAFHELATLCHEHTPHFKLPDLDPETSIQGSIEKKMENKEAATLRKKRVTGSNLFLPGMSGVALGARESKFVTEMRKQQNRKELFFCLPCDFKDEVHSQPPSYHHVQSLLYNPQHKPTKISYSGDVCECKEFCGDDCINRMLYTECFGDGTRGNCKVGKNCGNRAISQRKFAACKPAREKGKGWGLLSKNALHKGDLILEYIGDVIDEKEKENRLLEWERDHPNDPNFYIMSLRDQWYVDARVNANLSRFINHSCDPNCMLTQIVVNGYVRNGIFAKKDIAAGEILSYDYQFDTKQGDRFVCRCGATNCRGTMKGGTYKSPVKKSKAEIWEEAKRIFDRDKKFVQEFLEQNDTSTGKATVPAAENPDETVSNGIQSRYRSEVRASRLFLWRNGVVGSDFSSRLTNDR